MVIMEPAELSAEQIKELDKLRAKAIEHYNKYLRPDNHVSNKNYKIRKVYKRKVYKRKVHKS